MSNFHICPYRYFLRNTLKVLFGAGVILALIALFLLYSYQSKPSYNQSRIPRICITQITTHPSLDVIRKGIIDELSRAGYKAPHTLDIIYDNPLGNLTIAGQIAQKFVSQNPDIIIAITTPSTQSCMRLTKQHNIPLVFTGVTDPFAAKILQLEEVGQEIFPAPVYGISDFPPLEQQLKLITTLLPSAKKIGVLYNPGEVNSVSQLETLKNLSADLDLSIYADAVYKLADLSAAANHLFSKIDALLLLNDNLIISGLDTVLALAYNQKLPVFSSDPDSVSKGAIGARCIDQYEMGKQTGRLVAQILEQLHTQIPNPIPILQPAQRINYYFNIDAAHHLGIQIPEPLLIARSLNS